MSILLLSNDARLRKAVKSALAPRKVTARKVTTDTVPQRADAVVTISAISSAVGFLSMRLGTAYIYVLPEAVDALVSFVDDRDAAGESVVLAGGDVSKLDSLVKASVSGAGEQEVIL